MDIDASLCLIFNMCLISIYKLVILNEAQIFDDFSAQ